MQGQITKYRREKGRKESWCDRRGREDLPILFIIILQNFNGYITKVRLNLGPGAFIDNKSDMH